jgi:hypothetical protein
MKQRIKCLRCGQIFRRAEVKFHYCAQCVLTGDLHIYTHQDEDGMLWRFVGSRRVSALADQVMKDCGMEPWK